jgi:hypothetical protein
LPFAFIGKAWLNKKSKPKMRLGSALKRAQSGRMHLVANSATLESVVKVLDGMGQMLYFKFNWVTYKL